MQLPWALLTPQPSPSWALGLFLLRGWTTGWEEGENWGVGSSGDAVVLSAYPIQWREAWPVSPAGLIWTIKTPEILRLWLKMFPLQSAAGASHVWHLSYGQVRSWCPTALLNLGRLCRRRQVVFAGNVCPWVFYNFKADDSRHQLHFFFKVARETWFLLYPPPHRPGALYFLNTKWFLNVKKDVNCSQQRTQ